jgi:hypothetical protein
MLRIGMEAALQQRAVQAVESAAIAGEDLLDLMPVHHAPQVFVHRYLAPVQFVALAPIKKAS